jgi:N-acetyl-gamma-glutamyl-phosphate reductase
LRKDPAAKRDLMAASTWSFCACTTMLRANRLAMVGRIARASSPSKVIDASTAHRTAPDWVFGFPELVSPGQRAAIAAASG